MSSFGANRTVEESSKRSHLLQVIPTEKADWARKKHASELHVDITLMQNLENGQPHYKGYLGKVILQLLAQISE